MSNPLTVDSWPLIVASLLISHLFIAVLGGWAITAFWPMSPANWVWVLSVRVGWVVGAGLGAGAAVAWLGEGGLLRGLVWLVVGAALGALASLNPLLDLTRGLAVVEGVLNGEVSRGAVVRTTGASPTIHATVTVTGAEGEVLTVTPSGLQANRWEALQAAAGVQPGGRVRLTALRHVGVVLAVERR